MLKHLFYILILAFISSVVFADAPAIESSNNADYVPGQLVAVMPATNDFTAQSVDSLLASWGYSATRKQVRCHDLTLRVYQAPERGSAKAVEEAVRLFNNSFSAQSEGVKLLPNYLFKIANNDPCFNREDVYKDREGNPHQILLQWDMNNPGEFGGIAGADLHASEAWKLLPESHESVVVAVIDTGVDVQHPGLKGRIFTNNKGEVVGKDFTAWFGKGSFLDDHGHGSHCAGSIAAAYNDNEGMTGSSGPTKVQIIPIKALGKDGAGNLISIAEAMLWAGKQKADIISMSLGAVPLWPEQEPILKQVFDGIVASEELKDSILIAAAGNNGKDLHAFPAYCEKVIAIAASDHQDKLASFSNFGDWVDVASPGVNIVSVRGKHKGRFLDMYQDAGHKKAEYAIGNTPDTPYEERGYYIASGTSMATPNAAGVVAMVLAVNPSLKANTEAVRRLLMDTSDLKGNFKIKETGGRINALKALEAARNIK